MGHRQVVEEALLLTIPQLRTAVRRRLRDNVEAGRGPSTRWQLAKHLGWQPAQLYMVLAGTKSNRRLRVALETFALRRRPAVKSA